MRPLTSSSTIVIAMIAVGTSQYAAAGLIAYEPFDYSITDNSPNDNKDVDLANNYPGATLNSSNMKWRSGSSNHGVVSGSLSYTDSGGRILVTAGNKLSTLGGSNGSTSQGEFLNGINGNAINVNSGVIWVSAIMQHSSGSGEAVIMLQNGSSVDQSPFMGDARNNPVVWTLQGATPTSTADATQVTFLLARYDFDNDTAHLWVNPSLDAEPSLASALAATNTFTSASVQRFRLSSDGNNSVLWDELRFGTTFADVTPHVIPEPAMTGLLGLAAMGLKRRRRTCWA
ncbi:MAG: hypothetical protein KatS3mg104_0215 [Phycisphaerae bacterium]|jgi:hypothetical protein|nr:MAG: hypothetical protein KatS3mg104_0215 [Phycisphaerae bacterium]